LLRPSEISKSKKFWVDRRSNGLISECLTLGRRLNFCAPQTVSCECSLIPKGTEQRVNKAAVSAFA